MITTKKGDQGQTICGNKRVDKDTALVELIGTIDELQAILEMVGEDKISQDLTEIMGELSCEIKFEKYDLRIKQMEDEIKKMPELKEFVKFKKDKALKLNWARTICRRAERRLVSLKKETEIDKSILVYFNRLSDYLFFKAVKIN